MVEVSLFNNFIADSCSSTKATESANQIGIGILHAKLKLPPRSHIHATYSLRLCASPLSPSPVSFRLSAAPHARAQAEPTPCRVAQPGLRLGHLAGRWPQSNSPLLLFLAFTLPGSHSVVVQPMKLEGGRGGERHRHGRPAESSAKLHWLG